MLNRSSLKGLLGLFAIALCVLTPARSFVTFESGQVEPLTLTPSGDRLLALNTPDGRLEIYAVRSDGLVHEASLPVGMEPVALAARSDDEVWVVNHLSDSVSIVSLSGTPRVIRTLQVGDEPRAIVFAGGGASRAFITTAHRGQRRSDPELAGVPGAGGPQLFTPSVPRADVWVFDASNPGAVSAGVPLKIVELFTDTPRALAVSADGNTVYAAGFLTGNRTAVVSEGMVCDGFDETSCSGDGVTSPDGLANGELPGGLPGPSMDVHGDPAPETGIVVRYDDASGEWRDDAGRNWSNGIRFALPDKDVFAINATTLNVSSEISHVGTVLFNMAINPVSGKVYVSNTEAQNLTRFEGPGTFSGSTVQGNLHQARVSVINGSNVTTRHLNKHIDYAVTPAPAGVSDHSLSTPTDLLVSNDGETLYIAAFGSGKIGVLATSNLEDDSFDPLTDSANYIALSAGGPSGLALDENTDRLYVLTRFDNGISVIDTNSGAEIAHLQMPNPEPQAVVDGRPFLYDALLTSSNGEASCAACHVFGDFDALAWDLGNPDGEVKTNPIPIKLGNLVTATNPIPGINGTGNVDDLHPMKGPMTTQTLRGMVNSGAMHWRGDRSVGSFGTSATDSSISFLNFNEAFPGLVGRAEELTPAEMASYTAFALEIALPPNPVRNLDNSLTSTQQAGADFFSGTRLSDGFPFELFGEPAGFNCNGCHELDPAQGFFGTGQAASFENETQVMKVPHLRNMYQKVGMFGMPNVPFFNNTDNSHMGDQVRGTGFLHDGSTDTLIRFFNATVFNENFAGQVGFPNLQARRDMEEFMMAFDTDLAPIVGHQVTLTSSNFSDVEPRIDLLLARAAAPFESAFLGGTVTEADVVAHGFVNGAQRSWARQSDGSFLPADGGPAISAVALSELVDASDESLQYTAVPPGSGVRAGIDRDEDGVLDGVDVCPGVADAGQADGDSDGVGDACDNCTAATNASQFDSNGDGYGNACDADLDNSGLTNLVDLIQFKAAFTAMGLQDADLNGDGTVNLFDLIIFKNLFALPPGPSALHP